MSSTKRNSSYPEDHEMDSTEENTPLNYTSNNSQSKTTEKPIVNEKPKHYYSEKSEMKNDRPVSIQRGSKKFAAARDCVSPQAEEGEWEIDSSTSYPHRTNQIGKTKRSLLKEFDMSDSMPEGEQIELSVCRERKNGTTPASCAQPMSTSCSHTFHTPYTGPNSPIHPPNAPLRPKPQSRFPKMAYEAIFPHVQPFGFYNNGGLSSYHRRLASFDRWPIQVAQSPEDMALAGFYYERIGDSVTCFHCKKTLSNWVPNDIPMVEHQHFSPNCEFVRTRWESGILAI